jgi:hypothetical protein
VPAEEPHATVFGLNGIEVDVSNLFERWNMQMLSELSNVMHLVI